MGWQTSTRVMKARATNHTIDIIVEMLDGWRRHLSGRNASLLAFFTFLSIFPLMLAATSILGLVLEGNDELRNRIIDSAADEIPVIGADLKSDPDSINGSLWVVVVGIAGALWSSTKAFVGLQGALDDIWEIPVDDRDGMPEQRGRAIIGLLILGTAQVGSITITAIVNAANLPGISQILVALGTMVVNIVVIASMYRFLTSASPSPSFGDVWPGAIMAGIILCNLGEGSLKTHLVMNAARFPTSPSTTHSSQSGRSLSKARAARRWAWSNTSRRSTRRPGRRAHE